MVLHKELDQILWCILEGDTISQKDILVFLNEIPEVVLNKLREVIKKSEESILGELSQSINNQGEINTDDGVCYFYDISLGEQEKFFELTKRIRTQINDRYPYVNFGTTLTLAKSNLNETPDEEGHIWIGSFIHSIKIYNKIEASINKIKDSFYPFVDIQKGQVKAHGLVKENNVEYELVLTDEKNGCDLSRTDCQSGETELFPIYFADMVEDITLEYLNKRYIGDEKIKGKTKPSN